MSNSEEAMSYEVVRISTGSDAKRTRGGVRNSPPGEWPTLRLRALTRSLQIADGRVQLHIFENGIRGDGRGTDFMRE
jgi:hypothetical protein